MFGTGSTRYLIGCRRAKRTLDDAKREKMLSGLSEIVFNDVALIRCTVRSSSWVPGRTLVHDASRPVYAGHECRDLSEEL